MPPAMRLPVWKRLLFLLVPLVLLLALLEAGARVAGYGPSPGFEQTPQAYFFVSDAHLGWRNRAGGHYRYTLIEGAPVNTTDRHGYRNGTGWTPEESTPIILFVGDSAVFCGEVADEETITSELARRLDGVRVLNAGVRGYNTLQSLRWMTKTLDRFPEIALVVYLSSPNDLVENLNPITRYPLRAPTVSWEAAHQRLAEHEVDTLAAPPGEAFTPGTPPLATRASRWLRRHSALAHHVGLRLRALFGTPALLREKIVLDSGAVGPIDDGMPAWEAQRTWAMEAGGLDAFEALLRRGQQQSRWHGAAFAVTAFTRGGAPSAWYDTVQARAERVGVPFLDLRPAFTADPTTYAARRRDGLLDPHYGPHGTRTFAEAAAPHLARLLATPPDSLSPVRVADGQERHVVRGRGAAGEGTHGLLDAVEERGGGRGRRSQ